VIVRPRLIATTAVLLAALAAYAVLALSGTSEQAFDYDHPFDEQVSGGERGTRTQVSTRSERRDLREFLTFVVGDVQGFWEESFDQAGQDYVPAPVVAFRGTFPSACGQASPATGPFYCPLDRSVYLELGFFRALAIEFRAPGDFAQAYVIAHEVAHHVQNQTGILGQVEAATRQGQAPSNELSIRLELQADCLAGVWGHSTYERGLLERGDLTEGLRAAAAVGDDRIQRMTTGRINPETWTHGSSAQRRTWFVRGFEAGDPAACDTFSVEEV
jgi:predicted metalloprotease